MRITLNLATNPAISRRALWLAMGLLASGVLVLTVWVGVQAWRSWQEGANRARTGELRARLSELSQRQREYEARLQRPGARTVLERAGFYNHLLQRKAVSWAELFVALERHLPERARILGLAPELGKAGRLRLELRVGAESAAALVKFLQALEQDPEFEEIAVRSQQRAARTGEDAIVADVSATYRGGI